MDLSTTGNTNSDSEDIASGSTPAAPQAATAPEVMQTPEQDPTQKPPIVPPLYLRRNVGRLDKLKLRPHPLEFSLYYDA